MRSRPPRHAWRCLTALVLLGCGLPWGVPRVPAAESAPPRFHFRPAEGWFGDAHPIYWQGEWWCYYLRVPREPLRQALDDVHGALAVSRDLVHWREVELTHTDATRPWWAIAVFEQGHGLAAFHNTGTGYGLSESDDGIHWRDAANPLPVPYERVHAATEEQLLPRDPNLFRDPANGAYYLTVALKENAADQVGAMGRIGVTSSTDLRAWTPLKIAYNPGNIGVPECPEVFTLGGRYYLLASWGWDQVGQARWRWSTAPAGPWRAVPRDALDGPELQAPNSASDGRRRIMVGWVPTYSEQRDFSGAQWGGHMALPRELYAAADGQLYLRAPAELEQLRAGNLPGGEALALRSGTATLAAGTLRNPQGGDYAEAWLPSADQPYQEVQATFTLGPDCPEAGIVLQRSAGEHFQGYAVTINALRRTLEIKPHHDLRRVLSATPIDIEPGRPLRLRVLVDGGLIEAFLDDRWALAARTHRAVEGARSGVYAMRGACSVADVRHFRLQALFEVPAPSALNLYPEVAPARKGHGSAVLFPTSTANVYVPHDPALDFKGAFTLACQVWITPGMGDRKANLIVKGDGERPGYHYGLNLMPGRAIEVFAKTTGDFVGLTSPLGSAPPEGRWARIVATVEPAAGRLALYVDGQQVAQHTGAPFKLDPANQGALRLGRAAGLPHANAFYGALDDVALWDRALSATEISALAKAGATSAGEPLAAWNFNHWEWPVEGGVNRAKAANLNPHYPALRAGLYDGAVVHEDNAD